MIDNRGKRHFAWIWNEDFCREYCWWRTWVLCVLGSWVRGKSPAQKNHVQNESMLPSYRCGNGISGFVEASLSCPPNLPLHHWNRLDYPHDWGIELYLPAASDSLSTSGHRCWGWIHFVRSLELGLWDPSQRARDFPPDVCPFHDCSHPVYLWIWTCKMFSSGKVGV